VPLSEARRLIAAGTAKLKDTIKDGPSMLGVNTNNNDTLKSPQRKASDDQNKAPVFAPTLKVEINEGNNNNKYQVVKQEDNAKIDTIDETKTLSPEENL